MFRSTGVTSRETSAVRPSAVITAPIPSSTGTPAATTAPKATSSTPSVTGRLMISARLKSASSWRRTSLSIEPGPTSPTCRPGCADANRFVASSTGPTTSPGCFPATPVAWAELETASRPTASTRVRPSPAGTGRPTVATPLTPA